MRGALPVVLLVVIGGAVFLAWDRFGSSPALGQGAPATRGAITPDAQGEVPGTVAGTPEIEHTGGQRRTEISPGGPIVKPAAEPTKHLMRAGTFEHVVNGQPVPPHICKQAGLSPQDAEIVQRETAAENAAIVKKLKAFIATLPDFRHTADEIANASALDLMTWCAQYQPMHLEMADVTQYMDEDTNRRFRVERQEWSAFFPEDGLIMRFARAMHEVRRDTITRILDAGADAGAIDTLRTRYLLDGHFRLEADRPFDFGRDPGH